MAACHRWTARWKAFLLFRCIGAFNGYHADFRAWGEVLSPAIDLGSIDGVGEHGLTISAWCKYTDTTSGFAGVAVAVVSRSDDNFVNAFSGFGNSFMMSTGMNYGDHQTADQGRQWRHYAATFDGQEIVTYLDGKVVERKSSSYDISGWSTMDKPEFVLGAQCYHSSRSAEGRICNFGSTFFGQLDDVALYVGALTEAEVAERWNTSLSDRVERGSGMPRRLLGQRAPACLHMALMWGV